ncbi:50S ribosomal protein L32e [Candidatus Bathyarchaeota archaeon]|nr:50S ribosomal protein L32e [Candidatus Bathyarchaeota archaeon]
MEQADLEKALRLREQIKRKRPDFVRQESWRYDRLKENWRRPKGIDNKMRQKKKGWPPTVNVGYRGPKTTRGLHPSGYEEVLVHNVDEVAKVNPETQAIRIAHTVGKKTRMLIIAEAKKMNIKILNLRESEEFKSESVSAEETKGEQSEIGKEKASLNADKSSEEVKSYGES